MKLIFVNCRRTKLRLGAVSLMMSTNKPLELGTLHFVWKHQIHASVFPIIYCLLVENNKSGGDVRI